MLRGRRHGQDLVRAELAEGFWAAEAVALQRSIAGALSFVEKRGGEVSARVRFERGSEGRVVVLWRNRITGFVPPDHAGDLGRQLDAAGRRELVADARVLPYEGCWRIWVGPDWGGGGSEWLGGLDDGGGTAGVPGAPGGPPEPIDDLEPPQPTILSIPIKR